MQDCISIRGTHVKDYHQYTSYKECVISVCYDDVDGDYNYGMKEDAITISSTESFVCVCMQDEVPNLKVIIHNSMSCTHMHRQTQ